MTMFGLPIVVKLPSPSSMMLMDVACEQVVSAKNIAMIAINFCVMVCLLLVTKKPGHFYMPGLLPEIH